MFLKFHESFSNRAAVISVPTSEAKSRVEKSLRLCGNEQRMTLFIITADQ